jgi:hypothetical protein
METQVKAASGKRACEEVPGGGIKRLADGHGERAAGNGNGEDVSGRKPEGLGAESCLPKLPKNLTPAVAWKDVCEMAKAMARATPEVGFKKSCEVLTDEEFLRARLTRVDSLIGAAPAISLRCARPHHGHGYSSMPTHITRIIFLAVQYFFKAGTAAILGNRSRGFALPHSTR